MKKVISLLLILSFLFIPTGCTKKEDKNENENDDELGKIPDKVEEIYKAKNPNIGDNSADAKLMGLVFDYYSVKEKYKIKLDTELEPYTVMIHFEEEPDQIKVFNSAIILLSLIENCNKVVWSYQHNGEDQTFYITEKKVNKNLGIKDIKNYNVSSNNLYELVKLIDDYKDKNNQKVDNE